MGAIGVVFSAGGVVMISETLPAILASLPHGVVAVDAQGAFLMANAAAEHLLGVTGPCAPPGEWTTAYGIFLPDATTPFPPESLPLVRAIRGEATTDVEAFVRSERVPGLRLCLAGQPIYGEDGTVRGGVLTCREVAARERLDDVREKERTGLCEKLRRLDERKTQFFANVNHELRTPLTLILGPVETLLANGALTGSEREALKVVERNARMLLMHVSDLLDVAKLDAGRMGLRYAEVDLAEMLRVEASHFEGIARENGYRLNVVAPAQAPAQLDAEKVRRVLVNLLSNAFKFTPPGGTIRCELSALAGDGELPRGADRVTSADPGQSATSWRFEISDSGPGIPPDLRESIFDRFFQAEESSTRAHLGTGLGLAIAKDFVELQRGSLRVESSERGGAGATFVVTLPARAPEGAFVHESAKEVPASTGSGPAARGARSSPMDTRPLVLVVEDNADMSTHICDLMSDLYRTEAAFDGAEGLERVRALRPDLIVCDWMMPRMSGAQLVRALRADHAFDGIPIVMLTATADDDSRVALLREGAQDYLLKPFSSEELLARVSNLLDVAQTRRLLQAELSTTQAGLGPLVRELAQRRREAETAGLALRVAREQAERASKLKTEFLGMVSHEFRTPLTALRLQIQALERRPGDLQPRQIEAIHRLARSSSRLEELIESLLEYARIQAGCIKTKPETVDLAEVVRDVIEHCQPPEDIRVTCEAVGQHFVRSDPCLVRIVVSNLVGNAIKFTDRGIVEVTLSSERGGQRVSVRDTGRGIAPDDLARIFEPFEQVSLIRHKSLAGVGLGLALVREIVSALAGRIDVRSTLGVGSTFTVALPDVLDAPEESALRAHRFALA